MSKADGTPPNFLMKALIGMTAGATGAFVGTPAEVALIRMTSDGRYGGNCTIEQLLQFWSERKFKFL